MTGRDPWRRVARWALWLAPLFALPIGFLVLHRLGAVTRHPYIAYERTLIVNLVLYWLLASALGAALSDPRRVARYLRREWPGLVVMAVALAVSAAVAEAALRVLRPELVATRFRSIASERFHHRYTADAVGPGMGGIPVRTNRDGFRSPYQPEPFHRFEHRIAVLGDSFVFGLGVAEQDTATAVLERALRRTLGEDRVAVLNAGAVSYSPFIERVVFRDLVRGYRPTVTLLVLDVNDVGDDLEYARRNLSGDPDEPRFAVPADAGRTGACERSALCRAVRPFVHRPFGVLERLMPAFGDERDYYRFEVRVGDVVEHDRYFILRHPLEQTRVHFERTLGYVRQVAAAARAAGSEFVLVVSPRYFHWNDAECPENWELGLRYEVDEPYEDVYLEFFAAAAAEVDFPVFSLLPAFAGSGRAPLVFRHDPHWNAAGHEVVGEALARYLLETGPLAGAPRSRAAAGDERAARAVYSAAQAWTAVVKPSP